MKEEIKKKIWDNIRAVIMTCELTCGESIYQDSEIQESIADILYKILRPLLNELEKINFDEIEANNFDIDILLEKDVRD